MTPRVPVAPSELAGSLVHWNLAGWTRHRGDPTVVRRWAEHLLSGPRLPLAVTVNEVGSRQFDALADALAPAGFEAAAAWSISEFGQPGCASYGNAVLWRGGDRGVHRLTYPDGAQVDGARTFERRNALAVRLGDWPVQVVTTHLAARPGGVAARQLQVLERWLDGEAEGADPTDPPGRPSLGWAGTVLAGDLNLRPTDPALDPLYQRLTEAERLPRRLARPTSLGFRKLDYVFVGSSLRLASPLRLTFRPRASDHARLRVELELASSRASPT